MMFIFTNNLSYIVSQLRDHSNDSFLSPELVLFYGVATLTYLCLKMSEINHESCSCIN